MSITCQSRSLQAQDGVNIKWQCAHAVHEPGHHKACEVDFHHEQHRAGALLQRKSFSRSAGARPRQAKGLNRKDGQQGTWTAFFTAHGQTASRYYHECSELSLSIYRTHPSIIPAACWPVSNEEAPEAHPQRRQTLDC